MKKKNDIVISIFNNQKMGKKTNNKISNLEIL